MSRRGIRCQQHSREHCTECVRVLRDLSLSKPKFLAFGISGSSTLIVFLLVGPVLKISMSTAATSCSAQVQHRIRAH